MATPADVRTLAAQYFEAGDLGRAEQICRQIVQADPADVDSLCLLSMVTYRAGRRDEAIALLREALRVRSDLPVIHHNLGLLLAEHGRLEDAVSSLREAVRLRPDAAEAYNHLGKILQHLRRWQEAEASYREAVRLRSDLPDYHNDLAVALAEQGRFAPAEASFRAALRLRPDFPQAWHNLGITLAAQEKPEEAQSCYEQSLRLRPDCPETLDELGIALVAQAKVDEALACYRKAVALNPKLHYISSDLLRTLNYSAAYDPEATFAEHLRWAEHFAPTVAKDQPLHPVNRDPGRRLRIGYVSPDFREHVLGRLSEAVIAAHDPGQFEIFCYSNVRREDDRTQRIKRLAHHWRSVVQLSDEQAAELIRADQIDLLIDLSGHTGGNRLGVFAKKPAPIQVSYYGYQASTGLAAIDYRLTDAYCDPPGWTEHLHTEKLIRMPDLQWCYAPGPCPDVGPLPVQRGGEVTFGSFNNLPKVTDETIGLWAHILTELPGCRMIVLTGAGTAADERVRAAFRRHGIESERVTLVGKRPRQDYMRLYHDVAICLDTYPYCGNTTTADALWMGVPVVTRAGKTWLTRQGVGILTRAGLGDLVTESPAAYVQTAVRLARDLPRLRELRGQLRERVKRTLGDVGRFTRQLEAVYREMWQTYCAQASGGRESPEEAP